jgi:signal transduction histidine kinase
MYARIDQILWSKIRIRNTDERVQPAWFSSHGGIFRVAKTTLEAFVRGEISVITCLACGKQDGLPTLECSGGFQPAACQGKDGRLWFATVMGVVSVQPREIAVNQLPPSVIIESAATDGKPVSWAHADAKPTLRIGPGRFVLDIDYTGLSFTAPERVRFKHRLLGVDKDWYFAGDRRSVSYPYLPPGDYEFQVTACNNDGVWNETGASLALAVKPHLWQRKTFQAVAVATLVAGAAAWAFGYARLRARRRISQLERERALDKERARVARDLHDDLGAGLTEIGLIGGLADEVAVPLEQAQDYLRQITARSREMVTSLDEIVWSVNPKHDSVAALGNYFCDYAQHLLQLLPLRCRMEVVEPLPAHPLNSEQRHNLLMAFKEALTNVIRHSQAREVCIRIAAANGLLEIQVADDGRGGAGAADTSTADGLANMARRLADIGGRCAIESEPGRGTTVRFILPLSPSAKP